ncbi:hypothetical protein GW756_05045 [bacterium]|nr:hypothetical protein [bacterium]NCQ55744.1 hypothetical protein [Candidatus Parcubacteria bacterium]NCS67693.1 hypothetical protein [Candidatus Peregrinibacteria bacterium]NCS96707.1 hypothetical protein [bacterium]
MKFISHLAVEPKTQFLNLRQGPESGVESAEALRPEDIYMIGDSLTVGMASSIPGVRSNAEVGRSVRDMPAAVEAALASNPQPRVITILGGTNDGGNLGVMTPAYSQMIAAARAEGVPVVLATLPPLRGQSLDEANDFIRGLAAPDVTIVELANNPVGGDDVHFAEYGGPASEVLAAATEAAAAGGALDTAEVNTVADILRGRINPGAAISDEVIQAAAAHIAASIPNNLNTATLLDGAMEGMEPFSEDEHIATLTERVDELVAEEAEEREQATLTPEETAELQTMSNIEFLELPAGDRLRLITTNHVTSAEVASGEVSNLTFTFTFEGQYNEALWRDTTAGQSLPAEVRTVTSGGQSFSRRATSLGGEFFSENGQRLKIHEGTALSEIQTGDLAEIQAQYDAQLEAFSTVEEGEEPRTDGEMQVAQMALERGLEPDFLMAAFVEDHPIETETITQEGTEESPEASQSERLTPAYRAQLEDYLTDIDRAEGDFNGRFSGEDAREGSRLNPNFAAFFLGDGSTAEAVGETMTAAGYTEEEIEEAASYIAARQEFNSTGATNPLNTEILNSGEVEVVPEKRDQVNAAVEVCMANRSRYERVAAITGVPWELIAGIHYRESSNNFSTYLHNGQPLGQTTTIVPRGILFHNWEDAAIDALQGGYGNPSADDLNSQANFAERFNGMGYRNRGLSSPYVWAGHPQYENQGGMYVADGQFSATTRDPRVGVMPIVMVLRARQGNSTPAEALVA